MTDRLVITIDGPAGVGKSTVSKALARELSYVYLDTGAIYRAVAYKLLQAGVSPVNESLLKPFLEKMEILLENKEDHQRIFVDGEDVTDKIRTEEIGFAASSVSAIAIVREALLEIQRRAAAGGGIVAEGRDMGTIVFPNADVKFFLEASPTERIRRRYDELLLRGEVVDFERLVEGMTTRDKQDRERKIAPLKSHPEAVYIDSTDISVVEVVEKMMAVIRRRPDVNVTK
jgi:cytidylate kinase